MDVGRTQFDGVLQNLVDEMNDGGFVFGGFVKIRVLGIFINDLKTFFLVERADGVRTDAEAFFDFTLDGFRRGENRFEVQACHRFQRVETLRGKETAGGDLHRAVVARERKQFFLQQNTSGKKRQKLTVGINIVQVRESKAILMRQPAQDVFLGLNLGFGMNQQIRIN